MPDSQSSASPVDSEENFDVGLRDFFILVDLKVATSLLLAAISAAAVAFIPSVRAVLVVTLPGTASHIASVGWALIAAAPAAILATNYLVRDPTGRAAAAALACVAVLVGAATEIVVWTSAGASLVSTYLIAAGSFAALSAWGRMTDQNLHALGAFMSLALTGVILVLLTDILLDSAPFYLPLTLTILLPFFGFFACSLPRIRAMHFNSTGKTALGPVSTFGALSLYLAVVSLPLAIVAGEGLSPRASKAHCGDALRDGRKP